MSLFIHKAPLINSNSINNSEHIPSLPDKWPSRFHRAVCSAWWMSNAQNTLDDPVQRNHTLEKAFEETLCYASLCPAGFDLWVLVRLKRERLMGNKAATTIVVANDSGDRSTPSVDRDPQIRLPLVALTCRPLWWGELGGWQGDFASLEQCFDWFPSCISEWHRI